MPNTHEVWRVQSEDGEMGACLDWFATEKQADQHIRILQSGNPGAQPLKLRFNIPTSRKGLINWLNAHFETNNG